MGYGRWRRPKTFNHKGLSKTCQYQGRFKEGLIKSYNIKVYDDDEEK
jgi:hypothetical protein